MRLPARLMLSALIGRVRIPDPISARQPRGSRSDRRFPYSWNPKYPARIGVMPRDGDNSDVRWFDVEPCYVFHPMNAYDDGDTIVLDVVRHPKMFATENLGPNEGPPTLDRWTVDLADGKVRESQGRRPRSGVPPRRRATGRQAAPVRLRADRGRRHERQRRVAQARLRRGRSASHAHSGRIRRWASSSFSRPRRMPPRTTAC